MTTGRPRRGVHIGLSLSVVTILAFGCSTTEDLTVPEPARGSPSSATTSTNSDSSDDSSAASDELCAAAYRTPPPVLESLDEIINAYGCGEPVHLTPEDLTQLFPTVRWGTDTGRVEESLQSVSQMSASDCGVVERDSVEIIGAQVIELLSSDAAAWQDVIVVSTAADAEAIWLGRVRQAACEIDVAPDIRTEVAAMGGDISAGGGFSALLPGSTQVASGDDWAVLLPPRGPAVLAAWAGVYYTEVRLADEWVLRTNRRLTVEGEAVVDLVLRRLRGG